MYKRIVENKANLVHSRHMSVHNFIINVRSARAAYCFLRTIRRYSMYIWKITNNSTFLIILIPNLCNISFSDMSGFFAKTIGLLYLFV